MDQFMNSRWFNRGWTLQELIAPSNVRFYSADWTSFGVKAPLTGPFRKDLNAENNLTHEISGITRIGRDTLLDGVKPADSIARRMSWAARRQTTRIEDAAYSLLGLFGVNMPLLYGEGDAAFIRLQTEITKISDDQSIFAWGHELEQGRGAAFRGLLATSPSAFALSADFKPLRQDALNRPSPHEMTSRGVRLELELRFEHPGTQRCLGLLACDNPRTHEKVAIHLVTFSDKQIDRFIERLRSTAVSQYPPFRTAARVRSDICPVEFDSKIAMRYPHKAQTVIYVRQDQQMAEESIPLPPKSTFFVSLAKSEQRYKIVQG